MTHRLKSFLPLLLLLMLLPLRALADEAVFPLTGTEASLDKGKRIALLDSSVPNDYEWTSSDRKIATVDYKGRVTGRRAGTCTVTATHEDGSVHTCTVTVTQPVTRVYIDKSSISLDRGLTYALAPSIRPDDATDKTIAYTSSDESIASVDENGLITALRAGRATITATAKSGKKDSIRVTVTQPVTGITLDKNAVTVDKGDRISMSAEISPDDATSKKLTWTSSDRKIATVDSRGRITGRKAGTCTVTAKAKSGLTASVLVTVTQPVTRVYISPSRETVSRNNTYAITPSIRPDDATDKTLTYTSSHPHIASVDQNGVVTAHADGRATITATAKSGKKDTIRITVESIPVEGLTLDSYYLTLTPGATGVLNAAVLPSDASDRRVRFFSTDTSVVTAADNGMLTAVGTGSAMVNAVSVDNSAIIASCRVFVRDPNAEGRLSGVVIGINPGHQIKGDFSQAPLAPGSKETGNKIGVGCEGVKTGNTEYEINLQIGLKLRDRLEAEGATVIMTRTENDVHITNIERTEMLNKANVDLALQLHCNSSSTDNPNTKGIELYVRPTDAPAYTAAAYMLEGMIHETGALNRGVKKSDHYMSLNYSTVPAILVEMGYMSNPKEDVLLGTPEYQLKLVEGMYEGIARYCGR